MRNVKSLVVCGLSLFLVVMMALVAEAGSIAGTWKITFNTSHGQMEISGDNSKYSGRFMLSVWEDMLDLTVDGNRISFRRAVADQRYTGVITGGHMSGNFTQGGIGNYPWSADLQTTQGNTTPQAGGISSQEEIILNAMNTGGVGNGPTQPTVLNTSRPYQITNIMTYHWNNGRGTAAGGTIGLRSANGTMYGPWGVRTTPGQGGVPNAVWIANPNVIIPPGSYTVIDSDPATWAQNRQSGGRGMTEIKGKAQ
ncbi:MAG: hypothetical protein HQK88_03810 [Nitrospirae bacterium]|nr:hypothetical protein [Nitrospirota bacterium]MBF0533548.1 hypothetical protein [Nitrospirota bacterium]MBF0615928.1 hypothetical protein [Nitrospirota bacterium]